MDGKRFDDLSKVLGTAVTRQSVFQLLAGIGTAGFAAITGIDLADAKKGKGKGAHGQKNNNNGGNNKGKDNGGGGGASAEGKGKKGKGKGKGKNKKKSNKRQSDNVQAAANLCPGGGGPDNKICHCALGNPSNCNTVGNGGGHSDDPLDCCCLSGGNPNPDCVCPSGGETCCKPAGTSCSTDPQCCGDLVCCDKDNAGIGTCQEVCCTPLTCADFEGQCGTFDNDCGGEIECECPAGQGCCGNQCFEGGDECCEDGDCDEVVCQVADCDNGDCKYTDVPDGDQGPLCKGEDEFCCNGNDCCVSPEVCTGEGCCLPKTCADFQGQCGTFQDTCGGTVTCGCGQDEDCCNGECITAAQCCQTSECDPRLCQERDCVNHDCTYTPVDDNLPGPLCNQAGEFCCGGDDCCKTPEVCFEEECCLPLTCEDFQGRCGTFDDRCGGEITCGCGQGEDCCGGECITEAQCCAVDECQQRLCQERDCVNHDCTYTPVNDDLPGPLCNQEGEFCCGGDECCETPEVCFEEECCTPLTCAAFEGQCGTFDDECGGTVTCSCPAGQGCCDGQCFEGGNECCADPDCKEEICQVADCDNGDCKYTAVPDGDQGPLCTGEDKFCCGGDECCTEPQVCTGEGCCTPLTCAAYEGQCGTFTDNCGGTVACSCGEGEQCCQAAKICVADDACCPGITCDEVICQVADCVGTQCNYTPVKDNEQGPLCDAQSEFCCGGDECCTSPEVCTGEGCCTPKTCAVDFPDQCGVFPDGCGGEVSCTCGEGQGCCNGECIEGQQCCADSDCPLEVCQVADCLDNACDYTPVEDGQQGPLCTDEGDFCCNGNDCCEAGDLCTGQGCCTPKTCADYPGTCGPQDNGCGGQTAACTCPNPEDPCLDGVCCVPETEEEACAGAGRVCGLVSDGCGGEYDCGACSSQQTCLAGVCLAKGGKRCKGTGKAGQQCKGKKCKCKGGRRCHNRRCCEPKGDGSVHCNANSDCCPGLTCIRRQPGQHKVCIRNEAKSSSVTTTPGIALGALLTGLLAKGATRFFGSSSSDAAIALNDLGNQAVLQEV